MRARRTGKCSGCREPIRLGDEIVKNGSNVWVHIKCNKIEEVKCAMCDRPILFQEYRLRGVCKSCVASTDWKQGKDVWTPEAIRAMLLVDNRAVERALIALFNRQTEDEQVVDETRVLNRVGFSAADAKRLSKSAKWVISGHHIDGWFLKEARRRVLKYSRQLADIANATSTKKVKRVDFSKVVEDPNEQWVRYKNEFAQQEAAQEREAYS